MCVYPDCFIFLECYKWICTACFEAPLNEAKLSWSTCDRWSGDTLNKVTTWVCLQEGGGWTAVKPPIFYFFIFLFCACVFYKDLLSDITGFMRPYLHKIEFFLHSEHFSLYSAVFIYLIPPSTVATLCVNKSETEGYGKADSRGDCC